MSFQRHSSQPINWPVWDKTKPNATKNQTCKILQYKPENLSSHTDQQTQTSTSSKLDNSATLTFDPGISQSNMIRACHMSIKFGVDSSSCFHFIAHTNTYSDKVTDVTNYPTTPWLLLEWVINIARNTKVLWEEPHHHPSCREWTRPLHVLLAVQAQSINCRYTISIP